MGAETTIIPENDTMEDRLIRLLAQRFPDFLELYRLERLSGGASQETYRLELQLGPERRSFALRRAPSASPISDTGPGIEIEAVLMTLARQANVPTPEIFHVLEPADGLGRGFIMEWLEGETLGARIARSPEFEELRQSLAFQCGQILARIHRIDVGQGDLGQYLHKQSPEAAVRDMIETYQTLGTAQPMLDYAGQWLLANLPPAYELRLTHNDFRNGNIMVQPDRVVAVLDWELAHIGDPVRDLGWLCTNSWRFGRSHLPVGGFGTREDLLAGYETESGYRIDPVHLRFWEVYGSFWWGISSLAMASSYRAGTDTSVERPGIGRRTSECQIDLVNALLPGRSTKVENPDSNDNDALPTQEELLESVSAFLRGGLAGKLEGRDAFLAQVAANSVDIARRESRLMAKSGAGLQKAVEDLLGLEGSLPELRRALCSRIRDGAIPLTDTDLQDWLRRSVTVQIAIDQPKYSGYRTATGEK